MYIVESIEILSQLASDTWPSTLYATLFSFSRETGRVTNGPAWNPNSLSNVYNLCDKIFLGHLNLLIGLLHTYCKFIIVIN